VVFGRWCYPSRYVRPFDFFSRSCALDASYIDDDRVPVECLVIYNWSVVSLGKYHRGGCNSEPDSRIFYKADWCPQAEVHFSYVTQQRGKRVQGLKCR